MASKLRREFSSQSFLTHSGPGKKVLHCHKKSTIFSQGDKADAVFYFEKAR
jgi:hypothetical protein